MNTYLTKIPGMALAFLVLVFPGAVAAELKIGFVDLAKLSENAPQIKAAQAKIESEFSSREQELLALQRQITKLEDQLSKDGAVMSESERSKLERDILGKRRDLKRSREEYSDDLNIRKNEMLRKVNVEIGEVIDKYARSEKFDLILAQGVMYVSDRVDITDQILKKLSAGN